MEFNFIFDCDKCDHELSEIIYYSKGTESYFWAICSLCGKQFILPQNFLGETQDANT